MRLNDPSYQKAIDAVAEACVLARQIQSRLARSDTFTKSDSSPVTIADFAVQALICRRLRHIFGDFVMVGEENTRDLRQSQNAELLSSVRSALTDYWADVSAEKLLAAIDMGAGRPDAQGFWTLDPIDGTKGFLRGGQYAISLAYIYEHRVVFGILGCPNLSDEFTQTFDVPSASGSLFFAAEHEGAWAQPATGVTSDRTRPVLISVKPIGTPVRLCEPVESSHSNRAVIERIATALGAGYPLRLDSQCKYAVVSRGQADAYLRYPVSSSYVEHIWDHAAGVIIAKEAGATVTDTLNAELDFGAGTGLARNKGIVCAIPEVHSRIMAALIE